MKVNLLFGFLGSGKTTLAKHLLARPSNSVKTAIIVNEFGEVGVDGEILRGNNIDVVELNSGCLCCTLRGSLMMAVEELRDKAKVQRVIVEATGIAQPAELLETLAEFTGDRRLDIGPLVTVVDCAKMAKLESMLGDFYLDQIENADIIIANKIDLATPEQLEEATRRIRELNPEAEIMFAEQGRVPPERLFGEAGSDLLERFRAETLQPVGAVPQAQGALTSGMRDSNAHSSGHSHRHNDHDHDQAGHAHDHDPHADTPAQSFVVGAAGTGKRDGVERFFRSLPDNVWRAKGFIQLDGQPTLVQYSLGQLEMSVSATPASNAMVFIGQGMDRPGIEARFALATR